MLNLYIPKQLQIYLRKCQDICLEAELLVLITGVLCVVSFYVFDMMWHLYLETQMGQRFVIIFLVTLLPTLCLFTGAFRYTQELLPELGDVIQYSFPFSKWTWKKLVESWSYLAELWGRL